MTIAGIATRCVAILSALLLCGAASAQQLRKVNFGMASTSMSGMTARIAKEMNLFEKHGLDATISAMESSTITTAGVLSGSLDFAQGNGTEVVLAQAKGQQMVSIAPAFSVFGVVVVISKSAADKTGVSPNAPVNERLKALDGLVIGSAAPTASGTFALKPSAEALGAKIRFTYMAFPAMPAALETGAIDGFVASAPFYAPPILKGTAVAWINGHKGEFPAVNTPKNYGVINTRRDFALAHPDLVRDVKAVFADLSKAANERPDELKAAVRRLFPDMDAKTFDLLFEASLPGYKTTPLTVADLAHEIAFAKLTGQLGATDKLDPAAMMFP